MDEYQNYYQLCVVCSVQENEDLEIYIQTLEPLSLSVIPVSKEIVQIQALFFEEKKTPGLTDVSWTVLSEDMWNQPDVVTINGLKLQCPKTVFGHGDHPTTQLCQEILRDCSLTSESHLIDVGTGSGVLSFLAWQRGVSSIEAFDIDPFAIATARQNARDNTIPEEMFSVSDLFDWQPQKKADVLIANLPIDILERAFDRLRDWVILDGLMIVSGLTTTWASQFEASLGPSVSIVKKKILDEWGCYLLKVNF
ncbi:MAG: methyltransferase domain-containing protein [Candidatus Margulisbacteria bacterium]|nr:methyltransferase domain-containing protein [Candidatus Margulisiibacteriota bacterium]